MGKPRLSLLVADPSYSSNVGHMSTFCPCCGHPHGRGQNIKIGYSHGFRGFLGTYRSGLGLINLKRTKISGRYFRYKEMEFSEEIVAAALSDLEQNPVTTLPQTLGIHSDKLMME